MSNTRYVNHSNHRQHQSRKVIGWINF